MADEGAGDNTFETATGTYNNATTSTTAGPQKWVLSNGQWTLAHTLQSGLDLGVPCDVNGYPTGDNTQLEALDTPVGGTPPVLPWAPATDGLRNLTGRVNANGTVTIWAATSTVSGGGDQGADPNQVVTITDNLGATTLPAAESFPPFSDPAGQISGCVAVPVNTATGQATCTVTFVGEPADNIAGTYSGDPNYGPSSGNLAITVQPPGTVPEAPWTPLLPLAAVALGGGMVWQSRRRQGSRATS